MCTSLDPVLHRPAGFRGSILAAARRCDVFFELSQRLPLVFLPVRYIDPLFLSRVSHSQKLRRAVSSASEYGSDPIRRKVPHPGQQRFFLKLKSHLQWGQ